MDASCVDYPQTFVTGSGGRALQASMIEVYGQSNVLQRSAYEGGAVPALRSTKLEMYTERSMHETHLYGMQRIEPMPANETSSACEVGQKAIAAPEFRHSRYIGTSRNAIGAVLIPREVPPALPPQQLVQI